MLYTAILVISAVIIMIPNAPLIDISIWSQVLNGILLPFVLVSMIILINKKKIIGNYTNKPFQNIIGWGAVGMLVVLSVLLLILPLVGK